MIVIVSDLHLTDGTSGETIHSGAFAAFRERLRDLAYDASWRADGKYRPVEAVQVILLGDILDVIRSCKWLDGSIRPWSLIDDAFAAKFGDIGSSILDNNKESLAILRSLNDGKTITLPPATADGKPAHVSSDPGSPQRVPVKVEILYVAGNHDWFFHVPGPSFDRIRAKVAGVMGLANGNGPFAHDPLESEQLQKAFHDHRIWARHGDMFDAFNCERDRNSSSLGDAIVVELLNRFPAEVCRQLGNEVPEACALGLREIDNVRPVLMVPVWIHGLLRKTCSKPLSEKIMEVWDKLVDQFIENPFVQQHHKVFHLFDDVSKLEWALKFSKGVSLGSLSDVVGWVKKRLYRGEGAFYPNAFSEQEFKNRNARFIIYGHTHHEEIVPLDSVATTAGVVDQIYLNSGTWRAVHEEAQLHPAEHEFVGYHVMSYLAFFKGDERTGRAFETWTGTLSRS